MSKEFSLTTGSPAPEAAPPFQGSVEVTEDNGQLVITIDNFYVGTVPLDQVCVETIDMVVDLLQKKILSGLHHGIINAVYTHFRKGRIDMSIARQRREGAAALAVLLEGKKKAIDEAVELRDDAATQQATVELALVLQNNLAFILFVLKKFAGLILKLPGGAKPSGSISPTHTDEGGNLL